MVVGTDQQSFPGHECGSNSSCQLILKNLETVKRNKNKQTSKTEFKDNATICCRNGIDDGIFFVVYHLISCQNLMTDTESVVYNTKDKRDLHLSIDTLPLIILKQTTKKPRCLSLPLIDNDDVLNDNGSSSLSISIFFVVISMSLRWLTFPFSQGLKTNQYLYFSFINKSHLVAQKHLVFSCKNKSFQTYLDHSNKGHYKDVQNVIMTSFCFSLNLGHYG